MQGGWELNGRRWAENPRVALPAWVWPVVDLWLTCRQFRSPFGGQVLPCRGSPGEQPAALLDAFAIMDAVEVPGD